MNEPRAPTHRYDDPAVYEIRIKGHLDDRWADRFEGLTMTREDNGVTLLTESVIDQAALHSVLRAVRNLGVPLLSVTRIQPQSAATPDCNPQETSHHSTQEAQP